MCTERNQSLLESADGSMATVATRQEEKNLVQRKNKRTDLTPTGLLMEGVYTNYESSWFKVTEGYGCKPLKAVSILICRS